MRNFTFHNPVKVVFGKGEIAQLTTLVSRQQKILLTYGGGSIKQNGVYAQVMTALAEHNVIEFAGIEANPTYETLMQAVDIARREKVDFLLAVGGGSVVDGTKFIAAAVNFAGEPWDLLAKNAQVASALPMGAVLTLPATGSEMNTYAVISHKALGQKLAFGSPLLYPVFSILDPLTTFSLPARQVGNGIVDAFTHTMEQYLTFDVNAPLQDRFAESILLTLIEEGPKTLANLSDYDSRANMMWCATMALNELIGVGVPQDWTTHAIGHQLTALHGLDHARTLAIVLPAVMHYKRDKKEKKLIQYARRVWGIQESNQQHAIDQAITKTREFFASVGLPTTLSAYNITLSQVESIPSDLKNLGRVALGEHQDIDPAAVKEILALCL